MFVTIVEKDKRKQVVSKSEKYQREIYFYQEDEGAFSVCFCQNNETITYGTFSLKSVAKQMCYWLSGQMVQKESVSLDEFKLSCIENDTYKWYM